MISVRQLYDQAMFGSGSAGGFMGTPTSTPPLQSLKRRRQGSLEEEQGGGGGGGKGGEQQYSADSEGNTFVKRRRNGLFQHGRDTFQLSFLSPPTNTHPPMAGPFAAYKTYQPTPPIDSGSDSSSDRFAARFAVDEDRDEDMLDDSLAVGQCSDLPWRTPQVVIGPPTPASEMGPETGRLDVGDVDMDRRQGAAATAVEKKKAGLFRMGFRADCEKCRIRVPGHYSHY